LLTAAACAGRAHTTAPASAARLHAAEPAGASGKLPPRAVAAPDGAAPSTSALLARPELARYRGWLEYLDFQARHARERSGEAARAAAVQRRDEWVQRIAADPGTLEALRGVQEWAYE